MLLSVLLDISNLRNFQLQYTLESSSRYASYNGKKKDFTLMDKYISLSVPPIRANQGIKIINKTHKI